MSNHICTCGHVCVSEEKTPRAVCLDTAKELVTKQRQDVHGKPENTFSVIAEYWQVYLGANFDLVIPLQAYHVAEMMELLKMARSAAGAYNADNYFDRAGYCACAFELRKEPEDV